MRTIVIPLSYQFNHLKNKAMKTRVSSNYPAVQDCDLILSGHKYSLVKQLNSLYYLYNTGPQEVGVFETFEEAETIWNLLETTSIELI